jgi:hypothetical protein
MYEAQKLLFKMLSISLYLNRHLRRLHHRQWYNTIKMKYWLLVGAGGMAQAAPSGTAVVGPGEEPNIV